MYEYLVAFILVLMAFLTYRWVIVPKRMMSHYAKTFRSQGYKVSELPYKPYTASVYHMMEQDEKLKNDPFHTFKNQLVDSQILICNILTTPTVVVLTLDLFKEVTSVDKVMILPKEKDILEIFFSIVKKGVFAIQGNSWKQRRKLISQVFTFDLITSHIPMMVKVADNVFADFQASHLKEGKYKNAQKSFDGNLFKLMVKFTSSVVMSGFLGNNSLKEQYKGESITESIIKLVWMGTQTLNDPLLLIFGDKLISKRWRKSDREFCQLRDGINAILHSYIGKIKDQQQKQEGNRKPLQKNIIELMLSERKKVKQGSANYISDEELVDEIKTFMAAGSDTTSNFLTAMLLYVFEKPAIAERLRREIDTVIKSDQDINVENFKKLTYLECVILETSRIFPVAGGLFERRVMQDTTVSGITIKKGSLLSAYWLCLLYNPKNFQNPLEFIPERWDKQENKQKQQLASLIFSGGPRGCIGKNLALTETKVMMIKFMQRYDEVIEHSLSSAEGRGFSLKLTYEIKDSSVTLIKKEK